MAPSAKEVERLTTEARSDVNYSLESHGSGQTPIIPKSGSPHPSNQPLTLQPKLQRVSCHHSIFGQQEDASPPNMPPSEAALKLSNFLSLCVFPGEALQDFGFRGFRA